MFSSSNLISLPWSGSTYDGTVNLLFLSLRDGVKAYIQFDSKNMELVDGVLSTFKFTQ